MKMNTKAMGKPVRIPTMAASSDIRPRIASLIFGAHFFVWNVVPDNPDCFQEFGYALKQKQSDRDRDNCFERVNRRHPWALWKQFLLRSRLRGKAQRRIKKQDHGRKV